MAHLITCFSFKSEHDTATEYPSIAVRSTHVDQRSNVRLAISKPKLPIPAVIGKGEKCREKTSSQNSATLSESVGPFKGSADARIVQKWPERAMFQKFYILFLLPILTLQGVFNRRHNRHN